MTEEQLTKIGFVDGEFQLRNGFMILVDSAKNNRFCLCTGLDEFFDLTIYTIYDLTQFIKIMGS